MPAAKIVLNTERYRGEFELDIDGEPLTSLEWRWIKKISGYMPLTLDEGLAGGDPDVVLALAVIALVRAGRVAESEAVATSEVLARAPADGTAITLIASEEDEQSPPDEAALMPPTELPRRNTGESSQETSESQEHDQSPTGALAWGRSVT